MLRMKEVNLVYFHLFLYSLFLEPRIRVGAMIDHGHKSQDMMEGSKRF